MTGFIQLICSGTEQMFLNNDATIDFFHIIYRRYSNFFINTTVENDNNINNIENTVTSFIVPHSGDLLSESYLRLQSQENFIEILEKKDTNNTLNTNILDFYNNYSIKEDSFNKSDIEKIEIIKINLSNYLTIQYINLSNLDNQQEFQDLIINNQSLYLETDNLNIYYNINILYKFYSFITDAVLPENILNTDYLNILFNSIEYSQLKYIRIDFKYLETSFKIISNNDKYQELIELFLNNQDINDNNRFKISENDLYLYVSNENLTTLMFNNIYNSINETNTFINYKTKFQKTTTIINNEEFNEFILCNKEPFKYYIINYNDNVITNYSFDNFNNNDFNESLIQNETILINTFNLNNQNNLSSIFLLRLFVYLFNDGNINLEQFINIINRNTENNILSLSYLNSKYQNNNNFYIKTLELLFENNTVLASNDFYSSLVYQFETNNNYFINFINKRINNYISVIINKFIIFKEVLKLSLNNLKINNIINKIIDTILIFSSNTKLNIINNYIKLIVNFNSNNFLFDLFENIQILYYQELLKNFRDKNINEITYYYQYSFNFYKLTSNSTKVLKDIYNQQSNYIYQSTGKNTFNIYNNSFSIFPLSSSLFSNSNNYFNIKLKKFINEINTEIYEIYITNSFKFENIINNNFISKNEFIEINKNTIDDLTKNIINYYDKRIKISKLLKLKELNNYTNTINQYTCFDIYNENYNTIILNNIYLTINQQLFNNCFSNININKFYFSVGSPLYRLFYLFNFLCIMTEDTELINILPFDLITLRNFTLYFILLYFNIALPFNITNISYDFNNFNFNDRFICYDEINILDDIDNLSVSIYSPFYFIKTSDNNNTNNFDSIFIEEFEKFLVKYNNNFVNLENVIILVKEYFNKINNNFNDIIENFTLIIREPEQYTNIDELCYNPLIFVSNEIYNNNYQSTYSIGVLFDNINLINISIIDNLFNQIKNSDAEITDIYTVVNFNIKKNKNFIENENIIEIFEYLLSSFYELNNSCCLDVKNNYQNIINNFEKYWKNNITYLKNYLINKIIFVNGYNILIQYYKITKNEILLKSLEQENFEFPLFEIILILLFNFLKINLCSDINTFINNIDKYTNFNEFIINKYNNNIYINLLKELIIIFRTSNDINNLNYSILNIKNNNGTIEFYNLFDYSINDITNQYNKFIYSYIRRNILSSINNIDFEVINNELSLDESYEKVIQILYSETLYILQNLYTNLNNKYLEKNYNNYDNVIIENLLDIIKNYSITEHNYYETIFYRNSINENNLLKYSIHFFNDIINNSFNVEFEINRFLYYHMTQYVLTQINEEEIIYLKNNSLYDTVKMYKDNKFNYEKNLYITQNNLGFELLNLNIFNDVISPSNNSLFIDLIISYDNFYDEYLIFYNKCIEYNNQIFELLILNNGINTGLYFSDINNENELNDYINNFILLNEDFSPFNIYNNLIKFQNNSNEINSKYDIDKDNIMKKIVIYLFMIFLVYNKLPNFIIEHLNLRTDYYLEYLFPLQSIDFKIEDVINNNITYDLEKFIMTYYKNKLNLEVPIEYQAPYNDSFIIQVISNNLLNIDNFYTFCYEYISTYSINIGNEDLETLELTNTTINNFTITNILKNLNIIYNIDQVDNNNKKYDITNYSIKILNIYYENNITDINNDNNSQNIKSINYENMKKNYIDLFIKNINILLTLPNYLLNYYNIQINNQIDIVSNIISNTLLNNSYINEYVGKLKGNITKNNMYDDIIGYKVNSRSLTILKLSEMVNTYDNYKFSLITPLDYDKDIVFTNVNVVNNNEINIYKKLFNTNYNNYQWENNEEIIYRKKLEYYDKILTNNNILINIKRNNNQIYVKTFIDIFYTYLSNVYYLNNTTYFITFKKCLEIYLKYNKLVIFEKDNLIKNVCDFEEINKLIDNILNDKLTFIEDISNLITGIYFYLVFEKKVNDIEKNTIEEDFIYFFNNLDVDNNYFFEYQNTLYNYINKLEILNIDETIIQEQKDKLLDINNISEFFNVKNLENIDNTTFIYYKFIQTNDLTNLIDKFRLSINDLIEYTLNNSINYQLNLTYEEYFKDVIFEYTNYVNNSIENLEYKLSFKDFKYYTYEYIKYIVNTFDDNLIKNQFFGITENIYDEIFINTTLQKQIIFINNYWKFSSLNEKFIPIQNNSLYILYILKILVLMIKNQLGYTKNINNVLSYGNTYTTYNIKYNCLDISNSIPICLDYINTNYIRNNDLNNYFKKIMNKVIKLNVKYGILDNTQKYNNPTISKVYDVLVNKMCIDNESVLTLDLFPNVISNLINSNTDIIGNNNVLDVILKQILNALNKNFEPMIDILGGYIDTIGAEYSPSISQLNSYYKNNKIQINENSSTIMTLIFSNFKNFSLNKLNPSIVIVLSCFMLMIIFITVFGNNYQYNLNPIIECLVNEITVNVNNNNEEFINELNVIFENNYDNIQLIEISRIFFIRILMKKGLINDNIFIESDIEAQYQTRGNPEMKLDGRYYENVLIDKYIYNPKINVWKSMLLKIVGGNKSLVINNMKSISIDNIDLINIPLMYVNFIENIYNLIYEFGILNIMDRLDLLIGPQLVDHFTREYYEVIYDMTNINKVPTVAQFYGIDGNNIINTELAYIKKVFKRDYYIPLYFFFKDRRNALPLIACMYPIIQFKFYTNTNTIINNFYETSILIKNRPLYKLAMSYDFILLEREERKRISNNINDNLIERHNHYVLTKSIKNFDRSFNDNFITLMFEFELNNSVQQLFWSLSLFLNDYSLPNVLNPNSETSFILSTLFYIDGIKIDGIQPFISYMTKEQSRLNNERQIQYGQFDTVNRYLTTYRYNTRSDPDFPYYSYSFALCPETFQPTGSYNMSNTKRFGIQLVINKSKILEYIKGYGNLEKLSINMKLYTLEYNILRFQSSIGGLLFNK